ncbi:cobaltochelatase subunit CobN [Flammeovirga yaeyamensis]|uniref:Cobaltochelatase subunit CobN n=1 Tax=Flammeovirga yaeyamensis TaxID=367791 RepID=A0AAX1NAB2_9BACT|nr:cobaltochelatase subunit CobN [Flammeovirga yaeyamensis]MBB3701278.1 cobaltochelatase CobN [Flammeovirga yaeyamensis]NMF38252.1 cobaltochelatase subunit CobN [Flammeovirga yaeyamensis]QWG02663.1 cobaltochelatase subunit CobN [Flammeovirga yaeyamensis]
MKFIKANKKKILSSAGILLGMLLVYLYYATQVSVTQIAFIDFSEFQLSKINKVNDNDWIEINSLSKKNIDKASSYDVIYLFGRGLSLSADEQRALMKAGHMGTKVYVYASGNDDYNMLSNVDSLSKIEIDAYMDNGGEENYHQLLNFSRVNIDKKAWFLPEVKSPEIIPEDAYLSMGTTKAFTELDKVIDDQKKNKTYVDGQPTVALLTSVPGPFNANPDHIFDLQKALFQRGLNVITITSHKNRVAMMKETAPDLVVYLPHGRLAGHSREDVGKWLEEHNIPVLSPLSIFQKKEDWENSQKGMSGGMLSMNVVLPELDGAVAPYAFAVEMKDESGFLKFKGIPERIDRLADMCKNYVNIKKKPKSEQKIAIYYFKGPGMNAMVASNLEVEQSLYNTLKMLKAQGFKVDNMPKDQKAFHELIQKNGLVLGPYAKGKFNDFVKTADPVLVDTASYQQWTSKDLTKSAYGEVVKKFGDAPGEYLSVKEKDNAYIAVSRLDFGNVVMLPQPMPGLGDDSFKLVHGAKAAPPHPYIASYLWTKNDFKADAIIHFGTHGSLEFTPGKQVGLSSNDWSDALIGSTPHFYVYTISNIGEGIIAKRRSYATTVTHLTAPFTEGEVHNELKSLEEKLDKFYSVENANLKAKYKKSAIDLAKKMKIDEDLQLDFSGEVSDSSLFAISQYVEEIGNSKVANGLYSLGRPYTEKQLNETSLLMSLDPIAYSLAQLDVADGKIDQKQAEDARYFDKHYRQPSKSILKKLLTSRVTLTQAQNQMISKERLAKIEGWKKEEAIAKAHAKKHQKKKVDGKSGASQVKKKLEIPKEELLKQRAEAQKKGAIARKKMLYTQNVQNVFVGLENLLKSKENLKISTKQEQLSLVNGVKGGHILPTSGGDPIANAYAVPTGRNLYSIDAEATPSKESWELGKSLGKKLLDHHFEKNGEYPKKVSFTLWASSFIETEGATFAEILYLLGVEPVRGPYGKVMDVQLIPSEELDRPRVDVVVQTAGQFRDLAASRMFLINKAVKLAANADEIVENYVKAGVADAERYLKEKGMSPQKAQRFAADRVFGGVNGNYGTNIMGLVEKGDRWESEAEVATTYINNMGAVYGEEDWGEFAEGIFEAALQNTDVVVQPRQSNTWGGLSLDHVYEFMGGLSMAVRHTTGKDPDAYFNDYRNANNVKIQGVKEALMVEARSTLLNPKYLKGMMKEGATSAENVAETIRNTYGWNVMKPKEIDNHLWDDLMEVLVEDKYNLKTQEFFERENPYALEEVTAVMLETIRKGYWKASKEQIEKLIDVHQEMIDKHNAGCSEFVCDNIKLKDFIVENSSNQQLKESYQQQIAKIRELPTNQPTDVKEKKSIQLEKEVIQEETVDNSVEIEEGLTTTEIGITLGVLALLLLLIGIYYKQK